MSESEASSSGYYAFLKRLYIPDRDLPLAEKIRECDSVRKTKSVCCLNFNFLHIESNPINIIYFRKSVC